MQRRLGHGVVCQLRRLGEVALRLLAGAERGGAFSCPRQAVARLRADRRRIVCVGGGVVGGEVVEGNDLDDFLFAPALFELVCGHEVPCFAVGSGQCFVGDLAEQVLEEAVLAVLGGARVGLDAEDFFAGEGGEERLELGFGSAAERGECVFGERLAEHSGVLDHAPLIRREAVEAGRDQGVQRLGHLVCLDGAGEPVGGAVLDEGAAVEQHPDRLDGVERDPFGAREDLGAQAVREAGHEAREQLLHRWFGERLEIDRGEVAVARTPGGAAFEQFRARVRDDVDGGVARPFEQVLDEVEQRGVGPLHVLEHHHGRVHRGQALEEQAPGREQVVALVAAVLEREQVREPRLDETALLLVRQVLLDDRGELLPRRPRLLVLGDPGPHPHHVRKRPVGDTLAVGETPSAVPVGDLGEPVEVLVELPREP